MKIDVIVVGAGTGGCLVAKTIAEAGLKVCIIDRKKERNIGDKICGNAISKDPFDNLGCEYPSREMIKAEIIGGKIYSPDNESIFTLKGAGMSGFILDRRLFGQKLLKDAIDAGSVLHDQVQVLKPIIKNKSVTGVITKDLKTTEILNFNSKVVVDASGTSAIIRKNLPQNLGIDTEINRRDFVLCYREIRELSRPVTTLSFIELHLNQEIAPGGYYWIFPEGEMKVNVGLGVGMYKGFPNPKRCLYNSVLSTPLFTASKVQSGGGGQVPMRSPLPCMTGNGVLVVGDAAYQTNPIHGGGVGPSMLGGTIAGETIIDAFQKGDTSQEGLWPYNIKYMQLYGTKQAGLHIFRLSLQGLSNDDLNYGMRYSLITEDDILKTSVDGEVNLNIIEKTRRLFKGIRKLSLLRRLLETNILMKSIKTWYLEYPPSPSGIDKWKMRLHKLSEEAKMKIQSRSSSIIR